MTVPGAERLCLALIRVLLTASATVSHSKIEVSHSSHFWFAIESQSAIYYGCSVCGCFVWTPGRVSKTNRDLNKQYQPVIVCEYLCVFKVEICGADGGWRIT